RRRPRTSSHGPTGPAPGGGGVSHLLAGATMARGARSGGEGLTGFDGGLGHEPLAHQGPQGFAMAAMKEAEVSDVLEVEVAGAPVPALEGGARVPAREGVYRVGGRVQLVV